MTLRGTQITRLIKLVSLALILSMAVGMQIMLYLAWNQTSTANDIEIYHFLSQRAVKLKNNTNRNYGTGFIVTDKAGNRYTISNRHVCNHEDNIILAQYSNMASENLKIIRISRTSDLCLLNAFGTQTGIKLAERINIPSKVYTYGMPKSFFGAFEQGIAVKRTMVLNKKTNQEYAAIATTLRINFGSSGSPVVDSDMNLVGVIVSKDSNNYGFMVPLEEVDEFLNQGETK
jgi:S1-C subfamily serine protease